MLALSEVVTSPFESISNGVNDAHHRMVFHKLSTTEAMQMLSSWKALQRSVYAEAVYWL